MTRNLAEMRVARLGTIPMALETSGLEASTT